MSHFYQPDDDTWEGRMDSYIEEAERQITALRAALDQEREKVRALAESPPMASISLCCKIVRIGRWDEATMHDGGCYERNGRKLGPTYYLHDVSALLSGRGEGKS